MNSLLLQEAEKQVEICKIIGHSRRLLILWILSKGELSVNEIAVRAGSSLQNVSQHLRILKSANLVCTRREGQTIYYQISNNETLKNCPAMNNLPEGLDS